MVTVLEDAGYAVVDLSSAAQVVEKVIEISPAVIVLDITMPHIDGFTALTLLKSDQRTSGIPVLMASARGQKVVIEKARNPGAIDFLVKPWENGELEWRVGKFAKHRDQKAA